MRDRPVATLDTDDLAALRKSVSAVCAETCSSSAIHSFVDDDTDLDGRLWHEATALGWLGLTVPESLGGLGVGVSGIGMLAAELGRTLAPSAILPTAITLYAMATLPPDEHVDRWMGQLASGKQSAAVATTLTPAPTIQQSIDGALNGRITLWGDANAGMMLLPVGTAVAIVDLSALTLLREPTWDRTRHIVSVDLDGVLPGVIVEDARAASIALVNGLAVALATDALGTAEAALNKTIAYLGERRQFGRAVGGFQAIKHRVADHATRLLTAGHLIAQAIEAVDAESPGAEMWALLAKAGATEAATLVTGDCVQLHGGVGFTWEYDMHLHLNRARLNEMLLGTNAAVRDAAAASLAGVCRNGGTALDLSVA